MNKERDHKKWPKRLKNMNKRRGWKIWLKEEGKKYDKKEAEKYS